MVEQIKEVVYDGDEKKREKFLGEEKVTFGTQLIT